MENELELIDIADELVILNKKTIDSLFKLDNSSDCISLYLFYYKTAKWQKTNQIKATDEYVKKSLKWGKERIINTKKTLKENGLIDIIQKRENGKIAGWYIKVSYLINQRDIKDINIIVDSKRSQNQQVENSTSGFQDTNTLKEYNKCLNNNQKNAEQKSNKYFENDELNEIFIEFLELRKKKKAVNSERAINMLLNKLSKYDDDIKFKMIEKSIVNSWKDVYELKKDEMKQKTILKENVPSWYNQEQQDDFMSDEELREFEKMLGGK